MASKVYVAAKRCMAKTKRGEPCNGYAQGGGPYCFTHDPARAAERAKARKLGGVLVN